MAAEKADFPAKTMARLLGVSRSGFYDWLRREPPGDPWAEERSAVERCRPGSDRRFGAPAPTPMPGGDVTDLRTGRGWLYLAAVLDLCTRMVVGYIEGFHNRARPHSTIGYQTPAGKTEAFMERCDAAFAEPAAGSDGMPLAA